MSGHISVHRYTAYVCLSFLLSSVFMLQCDPPRQSLAEVEALRVRSDMLETDLKTCTMAAMPMPLVECKMDIVNH